MAGPVYPSRTKHIALVAILVLIVVLLVIRLSWPGDPRRANPRKGHLRDRFWTQAVTIPQDEQARRFDAAAKGVPDMPWGEAYLPPHYCGCY